MKLLICNSLAHFLTDAVCASALFGPIAAAGGDFSLALIIYNTVAFTFQCIAGLLADLLRRHERLAALGLALCAIAALLPLPGYAAAAVLGLGNCVFHVAGGTVTLKGSANAGPLGVFVAPGAVGLALGTLWPELRPWLCAAALLAAAAMWLGPGRAGARQAPAAACPGRRRSAHPRRRSPCDRLRGGLPWKTTAAMGLVTAVLAFAGKSLAALSRQARPHADRAHLRARRRGAHRLLRRLPCPRSSGLLLNLTMPVTLWLIYRAMPESPGFAWPRRLGALARAPRGPAHKPHRGLEQRAHPRLLAAGLAPSYMRKRNYRRCRYEN
ncbi:MAG: hypothetical protein ACLUEK_05330 [Oscillospiraceae bacterium]